jgi:dihydroxyacetone kinase-like predicted kinase
MQQQIIDGIILNRLFDSGYRNLKKNMNAVNDLNVFPVPDGDTGTNMSRTIDSGVKKISDDGDASLEDVAQDFAKGSLFGARGNSGVILSQIFAGITEGLGDCSEASAAELAKAWRGGDWL